MSDDLPRKIAKLVAKYGSTVPVYHKHQIWLLRWRTRDGWLWIDEHDTYWTVWSHFKTLDSSTVAVDIDKVTGQRSQRYGLTGAWKTAVTAWPVRDEKIAQRIFELVVQRVDHAHECLS